jgi:hypothetical protein
MSLQTEADVEEVVSRTMVARFPLEFADAESESRPEFLASLRTRGFGALRARPRGAKIAPCGVAWLLLLACRGR